MYIIILFILIFLGCESNSSSQSEYDCNNVLNGTAETDICGVCWGGNTGILENSTLDCNNECNGLALEDECGTCDSDITNDCVQDCAYNWGGSLVVDECGVCGGPGPTSNCGCDDIPQDFCDCDGNVIDECNICGGTGILDGTCNCNGDFLDQCNQCAGDNYFSLVDNGQPCNPGDNNCTNIIGECDCNGSLLDCAGECGGSQEDENYDGICDCAPNFSINYTSTSHNTFCVPDDFMHYNSMSFAAYFFENVTIDGVPIEDGDWVGAFYGDVCIGSREWVPDLCNGRCDVTVMGKDGSEFTDDYIVSEAIPTFKIYDVSLDVYHNVTLSDDYPFYSLATYIIEELNATTNESSNP